MWAEHERTKRRLTRILDEAKKETKHPIDNVEAIYTLREELRAVAQRWINDDEPPSTPGPTEST